MKRILTFAATVAAFGFVGAANAADMPAKMPVKAAPMVAPVCLWCGWYVGANIGYGWGMNSAPDAVPVDPGNVFGFTFAGNGYFDGGKNPTPNVQQKGVIGGVQVGFNWMISPNWVAGGVADFQASGMKASGVTNIPPGTLIAATQTNNVQTDWFGTVRAKLGFAQGSVLFYATGGLAYGQVKTSGQFNNAVFGSTTFTASTSSTRGGWAAGGGIDYAFAPRWSIGAEYLYLNLGRVSYTEINATFPASSVTISNRAAANIVRGTVNYKF